jgi:predicted dinucleotide-binding enzyme
MNIGVIGSGDVGRTLAAGFLRHGHAVTVGTRTPAKLADWAATHPGVTIADVAGAAASGEMVVLAVKGSAALAALPGCGADNLAGKPVIDATNPIADVPPVNGVLTFFTSLERSLLEELQDAFPAACLVKAFSCVGHALMVNPRFQGGEPTMFICGNDAAAKEIVRGILDQFGWETADMGSAVSARAIEPLCMLWCIPGFLRQEWAHAFKLLR